MTAYSRRRTAISIAIVVGALALTGLAAVFAAGVAG